MLDAVVEAVIGELPPPLTMLRDDVSDLHDGGHPLPPTTNDFLSIRAKLVVVVSIKALYRLGHDGDDERDTDDKDNDDNDSKDKTPCASTARESIIHFDLSYLDAASVLPLGCLVMSVESSCSTCFNILAIIHKRTLFSNTLRFV
jgi:hypothetical protein